MNPGRERYYRSLFKVSAVYDVLLGILFVFFPARAFDALAIPEKLPAFHGYLTLLGAFVLVIGIAYYLISRGDLRRNLDLILVGMLYKLAYCVVAFYYWLFESVPHPVFVAVFGVADAVFFVLMAECYQCLKKEAKS